MKVSRTSDTNKIYQRKYLGLFSVHLAKIAGIMVVLGHNMRLHDVVWDIVVGRCQVVVLAGWSPY